MPWSAEAVAGAGAFRMPAPVGIGKATGRRVLVSSRARPRELAKTVGWERSPEAASPGAASRPAPRRRRGRRRGMTAHRRQTPSGEQSGARAGVRWSDDQEARAKAFRPPGAWWRFAHRAATRKGRGVDPGRGG